jgi:hypothetical protein
MPIGHFDYIRVENGNHHQFQEYHILNDHIYLLINNDLMEIEDKHNHFGYYK